MQVPIEKAIQTLPSRARVGLALSATEHVVHALAKEATVLTAIRQGLADGWRWVHGEKVDPVQFYNRIDPLALASADYPIGTQRKNVLLSIVAGFYYTTGEIASYETLQGADQGYSTLGSDMADVEEEDLLECLHKAAESAADVSAEAQWQQNMADRLLTDFQTDDPDQIGPPIPREYFLR